jgi:ADP-heptose:LPS heptosyltransferase
MSNLRAIRRIAIFRALQLGDLIQAVPALRALRAGFPGAEITLIGLPWARSFVQRFSRYVDRFVEFAGFPGIDELEVIPGRAARFLEEQRSYGYDLAIQMHGSGRTSNRFVCALGARMTAGYFERPDGGTLTFAAPYPDDQPEVYRNLGLAKLLGCPAQDATLEFPLDESDNAEAAALLPHPRIGASILPVENREPVGTRFIASAACERRPGVDAMNRVPTGNRKDAELRIGIHAGARPPARRWPASYFATLADELARLCDAQIILTGSTDELSIVRSVEEHMTARPINLAGKTSLGGLAAIIDTLDLFISNDTGPAHIATALGTPSIIIFGPADYRRWAPLDQSLHRIVRHPVACSPCGFWDCPIDHRCLRKVSPESVLRTAGDLLAKGAVV